LWVTDHIIVPSYRTERGHIFYTLWSDEAATSFQGRYTAFTDMACFPKPAQPGGPKVLIGGITAPSLRCAATLGDGWILWAVTPQELQDGVARIRAYGGDRERTLVCVMPTDIGAHARERYIEVFGEEHTLLSGSMTTVARRVEEFEAAGVHHDACRWALLPMSGSPIRFRHGHQGGSGCLGPRWRSRLSAPGAKPTSWSSAATVRL
jgi:alkanesulfonate monooxygenase SsuD/methylene tetrahydromethanopterin reductase-like flavin-dependent oxidoreductase (luciferase family)